jgi:hypothetical protein
MPNEIALYGLDRVRKVLGDLFVAADYPGGPKQMHRDLLDAEHHADLISDRNAFATAVLRGDADDYMHAWHARFGESLCDHCNDLSARMLRVARDRAEAAHERERKALMRALHLIRTGLRGAVSSSEYYDADALLSKLARYFEIDEGSRSDG